MALEDNNLTQKFMCGKHKYPKWTYKSLSAFFGHLYWQHKGIISEGSEINTITITKEIRID